MFAEKLILVEGLPGVGKSTTAQHIATFFSQQKIRNQLYYECERENSVGFFNPSSPSYREDLIKAWETFVEKIAIAQIIVILEAHFWQNTAFYMLDMGYAPAEIVEIIQSITTRLFVLQPTLIYLSPAEIEPHVKWLFEMRGKEWSDRILARSLKRPYHHQRNHYDLMGIIAFFRDCNSLCEHLFGCFPYRKWKIQDPHSNWIGAYKLVDSYLALEKF